MSNLARFSKYSMVTLSTKDNTGTLKEHRMDETDFIKLHKHLMLKQNSGKNMSPPEKPKSIRNWLKDSPKDLQQLLPSDRELSARSGLELKSNFGKKPVKILQQSKPDSSKASKNNSKMSSTTKQKGKMLLDKIMSQRPSTKQAIMKPQQSRSKKSLRQDIMGSRASDHILDGLKKQASQTLKIDSQNQKKTLDSSGVAGEIRANLQKFKKFTTNLIESNNKYLKKIGKKNNLFEMRKFTEKMKSNDFLASTDLRMANSLMHDDQGSVDFPSPQGKGLYDTAAKAGLLKSDSRQYDLFRDRASVEDMAQSLESAESPAESHALVSSDLVAAMDTFQRRLGEAIRASELRVSRSLAAHNKSRR